MQDRIVTSGGKRSKRAYSLFLLGMGLCTLFFLFGSTMGIMKGSTTSALGFLLVAAGAFQCYRIYNNLTLQKGVLTLEGGRLTWEIGNQLTTIEMADVYSLHGWFGFCVLRDLGGRELLRFPEALENFQEIFDAISSYIVNARHNDVASADGAKNASHT
jgi:hypothetical protein